MTKELEKQDEEKAREDLKMMDCTSMKERYSLNKSH